MDTILQDLRYAFRLLARNPGFTAIAILTMALGIGASTSVFSLINAVLIRSLPYREPERLVYLWSPNPRFQLPFEYLTPMNADFFDLQRQNHSLASLALFGPAKFNVASEGRADALGGARVTGEFFKTMGSHQNLDDPWMMRTINRGGSRLLLSVIAYGRSSSERHRIYWVGHFSLTRNPIVLSGSCLLVLRSLTRRMQWMQRE
jgi:hypothetical protein